ncbi:MAG: DUF177 domain-containing protein [Salinarimonadaceae bacterium]|nr:MAG: DUF177 domain-containing protein [Salinarimonadaceae bacterium]
MTGDKTDNPSGKAPDPQENPLKRLVAVDRLPQKGAFHRVEVNDAERAALAAFLDLPSIEALLAEFTVVGAGRNVKLTGKVTARVAQICGVTLEPFETKVSEEVELTFVPQDRRPLSEEEIERRRIDPPDEIVNGKIDLGQVTSEFLALGLDPFPRKPGVVFESPAADEDEPSPFAALGKLRPKT